MLSQNTNIHGQQTGRIFYHQEQKKGGMWKLRHIRVRTENRGRDNYAIHFLVPHRVKTVSPSS